MYYRTTYHSPVGELTLACDDERLIGLWISGQKYYGCNLPAGAVEKGDTLAFHQTKDWLERYFAGKKPSASELPLAPIGGAFRQEVWEILRAIPHGKVVTYGDIAKMLAEKEGKASMSAQAVGGAVGHNPIGIVIPCHRVVGANGSLTGYAGGIAIKVRLLEHECVDMSRLFIPPTGTAL
jgi:methylated-DNA-[protein]-cysteine S-methyltransferase